MVEDDARLCAALKQALAGSYAQVLTAHDVAAAAKILDEFWPDLILVDFALGDGSAYDVLALVGSRQPDPIVVAISGRAEGVDGFELAQRGVSGFLSKPIALDTLERELRRIVDAPLLSPAPIKDAVGRVPLPDAEARLRNAMIDEAMERTGGSRRAAASLLGISRQLLQYLLRKR